MKKIIFLILLPSIILSLLKLDILKVQNNTNNVKVKVKAQTVSKQKSLYVSVVPQINQDYTINNLNVPKKENVVDFIPFDENEEGSDIQTETNDIKQDDNVADDNEVNENEVNDNEINNNEAKEEISSSLEDENNLDKETIEDENNDSKDNLDYNDVNNNLSDTKKIDLKNGFVNENGITYYYENGNKVTGIKQINGVNNYFSATGKYLGTSSIKVVDVSYYQKDINWDLFKEQSDCYGVILRLGYYDTLDKKFERNISELKRLNIPYGIYLFSYATTLNGAKKEALFTQNMISKYEITPTLGIYYDIESWSTKTSSSNNISKLRYDEIIQYYVNSVSNYVNYKYKVKVYSGRWYALNRLSDSARKYVDWVAEYNSTCKYNEAYSMWQYTSKAKIPGIEGLVDVSYIL